MKLCYRSHHTSSLSLHYLVKYQMTQSATPLTRCVINVDRAWHVAAKQPKLKFRRLCCSGCPSTDGLSMLTIHDSQPAKKSYCRWVGQSAAAFGWSRHWSVASRLRCVVQQQGGHIEQL